MSAPAAQRTIPYVNLVAQHAAMKQDILDAVAGVLDRADFILGAAVDEFEQAFARLCGVKHAVGVANGTDALILAMKALRIGEGDEIITAPNSFVSSATSIEMAGATPVFADVADDFNLDPVQVERAITPRTKAILPVHLTGRAADMSRLGAIAKEHRLLVIEDAAQAVLAEHAGRRVGSFGAAGCFSLHPLKTLNACGDGGIITTDNDAVAQDLRIRRNVGLRSRDEALYASPNSRLDTLQAAILLVKLRHLEGFTSARQANAARYRQLLSGIPQVLLPSEAGVFHVFMIQADQRDALKAHLADRGIATAVHYPVPIHLQPALRHLGYKRGDFPVTEQQADRILSLPVYPELTPDDLEYVADAIRAFYT